MGGTPSGRDHGRTNNNKIDGCRFDEDDSWNDESLSAETSAEAAVWERNPRNAYARVRCFEKKGTSERGSTATHVSERDIFEWRRWATSVPDEDKRRDHVQRTSNRIYTGARECVEVCA